MQQLRSVICSVLGHVDHGKSSILDRIRGTAIVKSEAGAITQSIGASIIPMETVRKVCGLMLDALKIEFTIPGLLFIDTPGHAAFSNLRKRGGNLADIAILVVDINEGFKPQTLEALEILRHYKTPFIIAANKIDLIGGWTSAPGSILKSFANQSPNVQQTVETKMYELVGRLSELGLQSERFDRVENYQKQVAMVPCSAKTGEGMAELLMVIAGLGQRYLEGRLHVDVGKPARGTVLEVKKERGLGTTLDVIIYDGTLRKNDTIVVGGLSEPIVTKVKALFEPLPLAEMRDKKAKFQSVESVSAATGVKVSALDIEDAVAGMPLIAANGGDIEEIKSAIMREVESVTIETERDGVIVKADSLGSLEAMLFMLKEKDVSVHRATVGNISRKDIADAKSMRERNPLLSAVLGFNVTVEAEAQADVGTVAVLTSPIIYSLVDQYEQWREREQKAREKKELSAMTPPCKIQLLKDYVFRQSSPAIVGTDVLFGTLRAGTPLMKDGVTITKVKSMQLEKDSVHEAAAGKQLAVAYDGVTVGRQIHDTDVLYSALTEEEFRTYKEHKKLLKDDEVRVLKEIAEMMRKKNPMWGI